jgi:Domain of unknown function (DUF4440)
MVKYLACTVAALLAGGCACLTSAPAMDNAQLLEQLVNLEKQSWVAWKARDGEFFSSFLSDDHVEVGFGGPVGKATVVGFVGSPICSVESYAVDSFRVTRIARDTALLVYHAEQRTTCGGAPVPSPVWASSLYVYRKGRRQNAAYQHTPAAK